MNDELKRCPFCGTEKYLEVVEFTDDDYQPPRFQCYVLCQNCFARGSLKGCREAAIEAWNKNFGEKIEAKA